MPNQSGRANGFAVVVVVGAVVVVAGAVVVVTMEVVVDDEVDVAGDNSGGGAEQATIDIRAAISHMRRMGFDDRKG